MPPEKRAFSRLEPLAMPRMTPWERVSMETVWLVSDQSQCRMQMASSTAAGTVEGSGGANGQMAK